LFGGVRSLGFIKLSPRTAETIIFFSFLILFEFFLVLADPHTENCEDAAPGIKFLLNAGSTQADCFSSISGLVLGFVPGPVSQARHIQAISKITTLQGVNIKFTTG